MAKVVTAEETGDYLVPHSTIDKPAPSGELPGFRMDSWQFDMKELLELIRELKREA